MGLESISEPDDIDMPDDDDALIADGDDDVALYSCHR